MRVLVVDPDRIEREATLRLLAAEGHETAVAADATAALQVIEHGKVDVALVEALLPGVPGTELVKRIRARESTTHLYVIVTASRPTNADLRMAFLAGADDFVRKPLTKDELVARIGAPARIKQWMARVATAPVAIHMPPSSGVPTSLPASLATALSGAARAVRGLGAWRDLPDLVTGDVAEMLGLSLVQAGGEESGLDGSTFVAAMTLSLPEVQLGVSLAVGLDDLSAGHLAATMLGTSKLPPEALGDMVREMANIAGGAFKRGANKEGTTFSTGLAAMSSTHAFRKSLAKARRAWRASVEGTPFLVRFEARAARIEVKRVPIAALREGMVVTADLCNETGALLMRRGTRVTESHLHGLMRALGELAYVEVSDVVGDAA